MPLDGEKSKRDKKQPPKIVMPTIPYTLANQYSFFSEPPGGLTRLAFGENDTFFVGVVLPTNLILDMLSKMGEVLRKQIIEQATGQPAPPLPGEEPTAEKPAAKSEEQPK